MPREGLVVRYRILAWLPAVLLFLALGSAWIERPGLQYDETLFVNAALGGPGEGFLHDKLWGVHFYLMPYIGALKAFVYAPVFFLFGVGAATIRIPALLISAGSLVLLFYLVEELANGWWAGAIVWLAATDPAFIFHSKLDWGWVVFMLFIRVAILVTFFAFLGQPSSRKLWLLAGLLLLGLYDKLNFIWFILAFFAGVLAFYRTQFVSALGRVARAWIILMVGVAGLGLLGYRIVTLGNSEMPSEGLWTSFMERLPHVWDLFRLTLDGRGVNDAVFTSPLGVTTLSFVFFIGASGVAVVLGIFNPRDRLVKLVGFFLTIVLAVFFQIAATPPAGGSHHVMMVYPLPYLVVVLTLSLFYSMLSRYSRNWAAFSIALPLVLLVLGQLRSDLTYLEKFESSVSYRPMWNSSIYRLAEVLNGLPDQGPVFSIEWGLHNQLMALSDGDRSRYHDIWPVFEHLGERPASEEHEFFKNVVEGDSLLVLFAKGASISPRVRANFLSLSNRYLRTRLVKVVCNSSGEAVYEIYSASVRKVMQ